MKKKILIGVLVTTVLLLTIGVTYSYFTGMIFGEGKKLKLAAANLRILFTDDSTLANNEIIPGWSESKSFTVKNESDDVFNYNIVFENLVNTFVTEGFLQYKITSPNGYNMEGYLDIPKSNTPTDTVLAYDIDIDVDETHEYTIEFIYHNSDVIDQSADMGKTFNGNLAITEGTVNPNIKYSVTMSSDNGTINPSVDETVKKGSLEFEVTPNEGYNLESMSVTCDPVANTIISNNKIIVSSILQDHNCIVSFDKKTYTVDIEVINGSSNAINKIVEHGESASATITPNIGYTLTNATVSGEGCSINNDTLTISNVTSNGKCIVTLPRDKYNVTLSGTGVTVSNTPQEVEYEGSTTFNVSANTGYTLSNAAVNCDGGAQASLSGNTVTVSNITQATTCTITPIQLSYDVTLVVNNGTGGSTKNVTHGGSTTFNVGANTGYNLTNPSITCTGSATGTISGSTVTIRNVTTVQTCTVNLNRNTYGVNVYSNNTGMGTVSPGSSVVSHGDNLTITLSPKTGHHYVSNNCGGTISGNTMTISNITSAKSCTVTYGINQYAVTVNSNNTNMGTIGNGSQTINHGGSMSVTLSPKTGYHYVSNNCGGTISGNTMTISNITAAKTCTVTYGINQYAVTVNSNNTNMGTIGNGSQTINHGGNMSVTLSPKTGYKYSSNNCGGTVSGNTMTISNIMAAKTCTVTFAINPNLKTLANTIKSVYPSQGARSSFNAIYTTTGLHTIADYDGNTSYYLTGNPNNWVSFAGKLWRIIRINGDGSVRLLYAGSGGEDGYLTDVGQTAYNPSYNHPAYVGWKYTKGGSLSADRGNSTVSPIYSKVKSWYDTLSNTDKAYINTSAVYCNDRNITSGSYDTSSTFYYAGYTRFVTNKNAPTLSCHASDQFKDGFGLMTADEVVMAGGLYGPNNASAYYYLNKDGGSATGSYWWWTMTPFDWFNGFARVFIMRGSNDPGRLNGTIVSSAGVVVRPVVSLKSSVVVTGGDGTGNSPYTLILP